MESTSLSVGAYSTGAGGLRYRNTGANSGNVTFRTNYTSAHSPYRNEGKGTYRNSNSPTINQLTNKELLFCNYCKKTGHTEAKCYKLHGFPSDFKFTIERNAGSTTANMMTSTDNMPTTDATGYNKHNNQCQRSLTTE